MFFQLKFNTNVIPSKYWHNCEIGFYINSYTNAGKNYTIIFKFVYPRSYKWNSDFATHLIQFRQSLIICMILNIKVLNSNNALTLTKKGGIYWLMKISVFVLLDWFCGKLNVRVRYKYLNVSIECVT